MVEYVRINGATLAYVISSTNVTQPLFITLHGGRGFGTYQVVLLKTISLI
jgi:proline iminopeptidase